MAATEWEKNIVPIPLSDLQPYAEASSYSRPVPSTRSEARGAIEDDFETSDPGKSYLEYLNRVFGFPHTSPDTMKESDFEKAFGMKLWSKCPCCNIIFKGDKRFDAHLKSVYIDGVDTQVCPKHNEDSKKAMFNCTLCKKNFDSNKRAKKALQQHLKAKSHMAKVNTEEEHKEHERLCDLVGISVD